MKRLVVMLCLLLGCTEGGDRPVAAKTPPTGPAPYLPADTKSPLETILAVCVVNAGLDADLVMERHGLMRGEGRCLTGIWGAECVRKKYVEETEEPVAISVERELMLMEHRMCREGTRSQKVEEALKRPRPHPLP